MAFRCTAQRYDYFLNNNNKNPFFLIDILAKYQEKAVKKESIWPKRPSANDTKNVIEHAQYVYKNSKNDNAGYKMCFPIIICQKVIK